MARHVHSVGKKTTGKWSRTITDDNERASRHRPGVDTVARDWNRRKRFIDRPDDPCEHYNDNKISDAFQKSNNESFIWYLLV